MVTKYLNKAKKEKKVVDFKHIKLLLTGSSAAGKSSFCRLLFGSEKFSAEYNSTDIMENKQAITVKEFSMSKQEGEVVWHELNLEKRIQYFKSLLVDKKFHDQKVVDDCGSANRETPEGNNNANDDDEMDDDDDKTPPEALQTDLEKKVVEAEPFPSIDMVKLVTVVDTGGQPEYIHLLPAINSYPAVTFLVHDLTKKLDDLVQVRYKKDGYEEAPVKIFKLSYLNMIKLLMCFVSDTLEQQPPEQMVPRISVPKKSFIGFVGTHYDKVKCDSTILKNVNDQLAHIVNEFESGGVLNPKEGIIHPVDNTTAGDGEKEDPNVKMIRSQIEHFADKTETKTLPITWLILQLRLQQLCTTDNKKYITYEEYTNVAKESLNDDEEIKASLMYFHFTGLLLYFEDPSLCDCIVINLQWLYSNLAKVMHLSSTEVTFVDYNHQKMFDEQRLMSKDDYKIQLKDVNPQELKYFFNLLIHLKVIVNVTLSSTHYYYLPCVLSNLIMHSEEHKYLLSESLLIRFKSGFLPRGFFCSLVVHLLNEQPKGWKHQLHKSAKNYSDLMMFCLPDGSFLYMYDKIAYLELEVRHSVLGFVSSYQRCIFSVLYNYLELVCKHLHFDPQNLQYGFLCKANQSDGDHIVVIDLSEISEFLSAELECSRKCSRVTKLNDSHKIWFEQVSTHVYNNIIVSQCVSIIICFSSTFCGHLHNYLLLLIDLMK